METSRANSNHWKFYNLPPFFTPQPSPSTLEKQTNLWISLLIDHASYHASKCSAGTSSALRYYHTRSDIFRNTELHRSLPVAAARKVLAALVRAYPNHAIRVAQDMNNLYGKDDNITSRETSRSNKMKHKEWVKSTTSDKSNHKSNSHRGNGKNNESHNISDSDNDEDCEFGVLITTVSGGFAELERSMQNWILEVGGGTTTTMLAKKGVIMTFDELAHAKCLTYISAEAGQNRSSANKAYYLSRNSCDDVPVGDVGALSEEQAIRLFLQVLQSQQLTITRLYKISLFNMDGSDTQPYQGVKFGGE